MLATVSSDLAGLDFSTASAAGESLATALPEGGKAFGSSGETVEVAVALIAAALSGEGAGATGCGASVVVEVDGCGIAGALTCRPK